MNIGSWISLLTWIMSQCLTVMLANAVAVSWWLTALRGQSLRYLHRHWQVGQSFTNISLRPSLFGWVYIASLAFTAFSGLETLVQKASSSTTAAAIYNTSVTATLANALPAGFSGVVAGVGHDAVDVVYLTEPFTQVLQSYSVQSPMFLSLLDGYPSTPNSWCITTIPGIGFQYTCDAWRGPLGLLTSDSGGFQPNVTVFSVGFSGPPSDEGGWSISMSVSWKDTPASETGTNPSGLSQIKCTLIPALVEYPVNVSQQSLSLLNSTSMVNLTANSTRPTGSSLSVDKVINILPMPDYDMIQSNAGPLDLNPGTHSTLGGITLALSWLFDSSIMMEFGAASYAGANVFLQGSFAASYAQFPAGTDPNKWVNNTFSSPMDALLSGIRNIMFRSSLAIVQQNIADYVMTDPGGPTMDILSTIVPVQNFTMPGQYVEYQTVYKTNRVILSIAVSLMFCALMAILPLYWGFWRLGRKVTLSPFEVAKAMQPWPDENEGESTGIHSVLDINGKSNRGFARRSNYTDDELIGLIGDVRVKYGEVAPDILGIGLYKKTGVPKRDHFY